MAPGTVLTGLGEGDTYHDGWITWTAISGSRWYRDGVVVGGWDKTYATSTADAGAVLQQIVRLAHPTCSDRWTIGITPPVTVIAPAKVVLRGGKAAARPSGPVMRVKVKGLVGSPSSGVITLSWKGPQNGTTTVTLPAGKAKAKVRLPRLRAGTYRVVASFLDASGRSQSAESAQVKVKIRR